MHGHTIKLNTLYVNRGLFRSDIFDKQLYIDWYCTCLPQEPGLLTKITQKH